MDFLTRSFRLGRIFDIDVHVHILFLLWIGYNLITAGSSWQIQLAFLAMLFGTVFVHELGHCFGARSVGGSAHNILMWPLGGLAYAQAPMRPWPQFVTVAAGPFVNVIFCLLSAAALIAATGSLGVVSPNPFRPVHYGYLSAEWQLYVALFYNINLILLAFNLLPIFPLDGGQIFRTIIWPHVGFNRATIISAQIGIAGAIALGGLGIMTGGFIMIGIAIFGGMTSFQHLQAARSGMLSEHYLSADSVIREKRNTRGFFSRLFKRDRRRPVEHPNPNPGGWEDRMRQREDEEAELDRLLRKVSTQGISSLSYVERQKLERITRSRQNRETEFQRDNRL
jgi:Zn-dependent protease